MALQAWTGRTTGQIDADSPVDIALIGGFDDDIMHLKQVLYGDGAGGFLTPIDGHEHNGSDSSYPALITGMSADDYRINYNDTERTTTAGSYAKLKETLVNAAGTFRIEFEMKNTIAFVFGKIYRNGSPVGTERTHNTGSYVAYSEDIAGWSVGDLVQVYAYAVAGSVYIKNLDVLSDSPPGSGRHIDL